MAIRLNILGKETPVWIEEPGPKVGLHEIEAFERELGYSLPPDYREFLLHFNGGRLVEGLVYGRDDQPDVPYMHGDAISKLHSLEPKGQSLEAYDRLSTPKEFDAYDAKLPLNAIPIANDDFGNYFLLCSCNGGWLVRFWCHEDSDIGVDSLEHRVVAEGFTDLLMRVRSLEQLEIDEKAERDAEYLALVSGAYPRFVDQELELVEPRYPGVRLWVRKGALAVFESKGHFSLHSDELSRSYLDLIFWMHQEATGHSLALESFDSILRSWFSETSNDFGLNGFSKNHVGSWWASRIASGDLTPDSSGFRFSPVAIDRIISVAKGF